MDDPRSLAEAIAPRARVKGASRPGLCERARAARAEFRPEFVDSRFGCATGVMMIDPFGEEGPSAHSSPSTPQLAAQPSRRERARDHERGLTSGIAEHRRPPGDGIRRRRRRRSARRPERRPRGSAHPGRSADDGLRLGRRGPGGGQDGPRPSAARARPGCPPQAARRPQEGRGGADTREGSRAQRARPPAFPRV